MDRRNGVMFVAKIISQIGYQSKREFGNDKLTLLLKINCR
jgi:hypothetical protein